MIRWKALKAALPWRTPCKHSQTLRCYLQLVMPTRQRETGSAAQPLTSSHSMYFLTGLDSRFATSSKPAEEGLTFDTMLPGACQSLKGILRDG